jgi:hypothetical protein
MPSLVVDDTKNIYKMNILNRDGEPIKRETWMFYSKDFLELKLVSEFVDFVKSLNLNESI